MSRPPLNPEKSAAGIIVDPQTFERVIPQSRRPDGSVRKELKVRPGFTPQEDVKRFRGTKQAQMDATALPKGHIIGWVAPSASEPAQPKSKSAKKNAKRKEKRDEKRTDAASEEPVRESWEDEDEDDSASKAPSAGTDVTPAPTDTAKASVSPSPGKRNGTTVVSPNAIQKLAADLERLGTK